VGSLQLISCFYLGAGDTIESWEDGQERDRLGRISCVYLGAEGTIESWEAWRGCDRWGHIS
jgi:hypothetical protein